MTMKALLYSAVEQQVMRHLDIQFAMMVAGNDEPAVMLAAAILSRDVGEGHVCLPLTRLFTCYETSAPLQACFSLVGAVNWSKILLCSTAVSKGDVPTPLILSAERLYFNRMWLNELVITRFFGKINHLLPYNKVLLSCKLNELFETKELIDYKKIAAAVALTRRISVISGEAGTNKTTIVAKILIILILIIGEQKCRIKLAAPTGKAAVRLAKLLNNALRYLPINLAQRQYFPSEAVTLHRLLDIHYNTHKMSYHKGNPLHLDVLVVDEASMIDLTMMSLLINALPPHARVIFLSGDHDQLYSINTGSVLDDICMYASKGYTLKRAHELSQLTGYLIEHNSSLVASKLRDTFCLLRKSRSFSGNSGISNLAEAVKRGDCHAIKTIFGSNFSDIRKSVLRTSEDYLRMLEEVLEAYSCFLRCVHQKDNPEKVLLTFDQFQLLCALREGPFGVAGLNERLERVLFKTRSLSFTPGSSWYEGRPIIILRNDSNLELFNGDIGVTLDYGLGLRVWFRMPNGTIKAIHPSRLPEHETAWAITVHKSQSSEFNQTALLLPVQAMPILTRELVYTGITRARKFLSLYTDDLVLMKAVMTRTERRSGLSVMFEST